MHSSSKKNRDPASNLQYLSSNQAHLKDIMKNEINYSKENASQKSNSRHHFNQTLTGGDGSGKKLDQILNSSLERIEASAENLRHLQSVRDKNELQNQILDQNE